MSRFKIPDGSPRMRPANVSPGPEFIIRLSICIQQTWPKDPALISTSADQFLLIQLPRLIDIHCSVPVENTGFLTGLLAAVDHTVSYDRTIILMTVVAVGISVDRQYGFHSCRHIRKFFRIANSIGILCKRSLEAGNITNINIRQHIGNFTSVFCITATVCVIHSSGIVLMMRNLNGQIGTCV